MKQLLFTVAWPLLLSVLVFSVGAVPPTNRRSVEQKLAGLRIGVDTRATIRFRFGPLRNDRGQGYLQVGNSCEMRFVFTDADDKRAKPDATVTVIMLRRSAPDSINPRCDALATGMGLRFGDEPDRIQRVYGRPEIHLDEGDIAFERYHNYAECGKDRKRMIHAKDLMIRWNRVTRRIVEVNVEGGLTPCSEILAD